MLGSLIPEFCNQQGDQGFLDLYRSNGNETKDVASAADLEGVSLLYVGDASSSGLELINEQLPSMIDEIKARLNAGMDIFAVGKSGSLIATALGVGPLVGSEYKSEFVSVEFEGIELVGYVNGEFISPYIKVDEIGGGQLIQCGLLGPALAINPGLRNMVLQKSKLSQIPETEIETLVREHYRLEASS